MQNSAEFRVNISITHSKTGKVISVREAIRKVAKIESTLRFKESDTTEK